MKLFNRKPASWTLFVAPNLFRNANSDVEYVEREYTDFDAFIEALKAEADDLLATTISGLKDGTTLNLCRKGYDKMVFATQSKNLIDFSTKINVGHVETLEATRCPKDEEVAAIVACHRPLNRAPIKINERILDSFKLLFS